MAGMALASIAPNAIVLSLFFFTTGAASSLAQTTFVESSTEPAARCRDGRSSRR